MSDRYAAARERLKFGSRIVPEGCSDVIVRESLDELHIESWSRGDLEDV